MSMQSLPLAYSRVTLLFLCANFSKYHYWNDKYFNSDDKLIKQLDKEFNDILNDTLYLTNIRNMNKNKLIPEIKDESDKIFKMIQDKIKKDGLKFKYKYNEFTYQHNMQLLEHLSQQKKKNKYFTLNKDTLTYIYENVFNKKFSRKTLYRKCFQYGFEYHS